MILDKGVAYHPMFQKWYKIGGKYAGGGVDSLYVSVDC
jgi:hypothetical protein